MGDLVKYILAIEQNNHDKVINTLTSIIDKKQSNNKKKKILLLKSRIKAYFRNKNYQSVLNDCVKLGSIGYIIADDEHISIIEAESQYRVDKKKAVQTLNSISNKFKRKKIANWANNLDAIDEDEMFDKDGSF
ncbi:unnamed protein product [Rotaria sp. Silwood2]|nr:unnamed protein product [Rotaria sp. Silwood2]CAF3245645.1 unnamed protein product [Rotaria sp. Silwood2]CAF3345645.1 unnamed protein product [Rotaria sp. Silwood2]CAF4185430.1 unnamed protein product [Rotaria sp. Silwood2]CAF4295551.1 unnamed protein product [Rotaria sp. Silwood2]